MSAEVTIRYHRPPDRLQVFRQRLVAREEDCVVTLLEAAELPAPVRVEGETILDPGAPVVWFTFPDVWHDIGRFHRSDGTFTGFYANVLTPVAGVDGSDWETTDLFLDVWLAADGAAPRLLDEEEFHAAVRAGWLEPAVSRRASVEGTRLLAAAAMDAWPPAAVSRWTLEAATRTLARP